MLIQICVTILFDQLVIKYYLLKKFWLLEIMFNYVIGKYYCINLIVCINKIWSYKMAFVTLIQNDITSARA